jgi:hypothetical protein
MKKLQLWYSSEPNSTLSNSAVSEISGRTKQLHQRLASKAFLRLGHIISEVKTKQNDTQK